MTEQCDCVYRCDICENIPAINHIKDNHYCDECVEFIEDIQDTDNKKNTNFTDCDNCNKCDMKIFMKKSGLNIYCEECYELTFYGNGKYCELCKKYVPKYYEHCGFCGDCGPPGRPH
jgi:hypothetical protein